MKQWNSLSRVFLLLVLLIGLLAGAFAPAFVNQNVKAAPLAQASSCSSGGTIAKWTFTGNVATPSTGSGIFANGSGLNPAVPPYTYFGGPTDPAISFSGWATLLDPNDYLEFAVDTTGKINIGINFDYRSTGTGPNTLELDYSTDGTTFTPFSTTTSLTTDSIFHTLSFDLSSISMLNNNSNAKFRFYAYGATAPAGTLRLDNVAFYCIPTVTIDQASGQADPAGAVPVNFAVKFSQPINVSSFTASDITPNGTATGVTWSITDSGDHMNFTLSATAVTSNGTIIPSIAAKQVTDVDGYNNSASTSTDNTVNYQDTIAPTVTINQASGQPDPATTLPINFAVVFSEPINVSSFTVSDITQSGTATGITWIITDSGDHMNFSLSATVVAGSGTLIPSIAVNLVADAVGNMNTLASTIITDNTVTYAPTPTATPTATPGPAARLSVLINEVAWAGTSLARTNDEWIELYNTGTTAVNLEGWKLESYDGGTVSDLALFGAGDTISAGGFFLLARPLSGTCTGADDINIFRNMPVNVPVKCFSKPLTNNPNGQALSLWDKYGTQVDVANNDRGSWPAGSLYSSMERRGKIEDSSPNAWVTYAGIPVVGDTLNRDGVLVKGTPGKVNWITTVPPPPTRTPTPRPKYRTPTPLPTLRPVGRPFINEFLPRPGFDWNQDGKVDVFDEFIELKNVGNADLNLSGWQLDDGANHPGIVTSAPYTITAIILKPGEYALFYGSQTNIQLSDGGDSVRLFDAAGKLVDVRDYSIAKFPDQSICRFPDGNGFGSWFNDCTPTPGLTNSRTGNVPTLPGGANSEAQVCDLPDTLPADFLFAECRGYGADIWNSFYWDKFGWQGDQIIHEIMNKWESFVN